MDHSRRDPSVRHAQMNLRGNACFDFEFYFAKNSGVRSMSQTQAWLHWLDSGQFTGEWFR
jgi:hypothetical protein